MDVRWKREDGQNGYLFIFTTYKILLKDGWNLLMWPQLSLVSSIMILDFLVSWSWRIGFDNSGMDHRRTDNEYPIPYVLCALGKSGTMGYRYQVGGNRNRRVERKKRGNFQLIIERTYPISRPIYFPTVIHRSQQSYWKWGWDSGHWLSKASEHSGAYCTINPDEIDLRFQMHHPVSIWESCCWASARRALANW